MKGMWHHSMEGNTNLHSLQPSIPRTREQRDNVQGKLHPGHHAAKITQGNKKYSAEVMFVQELLCCGIPGNSLDNLPLVPCLPELLTPVQVPEDSRSALLGTAE